MDNFQIQALRQIGSEWQKAGKHRIYFNGLSAWLGLEVSRYNTGNVSSARLNGDGISNCQAKRILSRMMDAKLYYDFETKRFHGQRIDNDDFQAIVVAIKTERDELAAKLQTENEVLA